MFVGLQYKLNASAAFLPRKIYFFVDGKGFLPRIIRNHFSRPARRRH